MRRSNGIDGRHAPKVRLLIRRGSSLVPCTLDLGTSHLLAEKRLSTKKEFVVIPSGIVAAGKSLKAVEIELTLKASHFALLEILRKHRVYKLLWLVNDKAAAMWLHIRKSGEIA